MHKKKGFIASQTFLYAFGALVVVIILIIGLKGINTFKSTSDDSSLTIFKASFTSDMENTALRKGEVKQFSYVVPAGYTSFCVFDIYQNMSVLNYTSLFDFYPKLRDSLSYKTENVFLLGDGKFEAFKVPEARIKSPFYFCQDIDNNKIILSARGVIISGDYAALLLIDHKVAVDVSKTIISVQDTFLSQVRYKLLTNLEIKSADSFLTLSIPKDMIISFPGNETELSIELVGPASPPISYKFEPIGVTFAHINKKAIIKQKVPSCESIKLQKYSYLQVGNEQLTNPQCADSYAIYQITGIN